MFLVDTLLQGSGGSGSGNPFDQSLNTTNSPNFVNLTASGFLRAQDHGVFGNGDPTGTTGQLRVVTDATVPTFSLIRVGTGSWFIENTGAGYPTNLSITSDGDGFMTIGERFARCTETIAAAGTNQGNAADLTADYSIVTGGDGTVGVQLTTTVGGSHTIRSTGTGYLKVYPPTDGTINGGAANAAVTVGPGVTVTFHHFATDTWYSTPQIAADADNFFTYNPTGGAGASGALELWIGGFLSSSWDSNGLTSSEHLLITGGKKLYLEGTVGTPGDSYIWHDGSALAFVEDSTTTLLIASTGLYLATGSLLQSASGSGSFKIGAAGDSIGFFGATAVVQQNHIADPSAGGTVDTQARTAIVAILDLLEAYGFAKTS